MYVLLSSRIKYLKLALKSQCKIKWQLNDKNNMLNLHEGYFAAMVSQDTVK